MPGDLLLRRVGDRLRRLLDEDLSKLLRLGDLDLRFGDGLRRLRRSGDLVFDRSARLPLGEKERLRRLEDLVLGRIERPLSPRGEKERRLLLRLGESDRRLLLRLGESDRRLRKRFGEQVLGLNDRLLELRRGDRDRRRLRLGEQVFGLKSKSPRRDRERRLRRVGEREDRLTYDPLRRPDEFLLRRGLGDLVLRCGDHLPRVLRNGDRDFLRHVGVLSSLPRRRGDGPRRVSLSIDSSLIMESERRVDGRPYPRVVLLRLYERSFSKSRS